MLSDPLTDIVRSLDLSGAVFLNTEFNAPWAIAADAIRADGRPFKPAPRQIMAYHMVTEGEAIVSLARSSDCRQYRRVKAGEVIFLPSNAPHRLAGGTGQHAVSSDNLLSLSTRHRGPIRIAYGGAGVRTQILCSFMASNSEPSPLFGTLSELLVISIERIETRRWIEASLAMAAREFTPGRRSDHATVSGLCRLLLIEALRNCVEQTRSPDGWLNGMAHPRIGRALARIHTNPASPPRVEQLAQEIGMSRSAFVDRFTEVMGVGPRRYILTHRMETAAALLRENGLTTAEIAYRVGYDAPEAFSRAFKRETGRSPIEWRLHSSADA